MREENTGRGRPRKLYRLTPAAEFTDVPRPGAMPTPLPGGAVMTRENLEILHDSGAFNPSPRHQELSPPMSRSTP